MRLKVDCSQLIVLAVVLTTAAGGIFANIYSNQLEGWWKDNAGWLFFGLTALALVLGVMQARAARNPTNSPQVGTRPKPEPLPLASLPSGGSRTFPIRRKDFVGRDDVMVQLDAARRTGPRVQVLTGIGGVGKTATAIEYGHRYAHEFDMRCWVDAEDPALIPAALAQHARNLGYARDVDADRDAVHRLVTQLQTHSRWLLVFDNAEGILTTVTAHVPEAEGQVIIMSRCPGWEATRPW